MPYVLVITLLGAVLRLWALGDRPPGLYHDEAFYALDALGVLAGARPIFFEANNGREPLFIYLTSAGVGLLGRTPVAVRLIAALVGILTIPATYLLGRALFSTRVGLLVASLAAISVWTINLSRVGFRAVTMPLVLALCLWQGALAFQTGRTRHFVLAGVLYGLLFYTYLAARFTPVALALVALVWLLGQRPAKASTPSIPWRGLAVAALTALIVVAPLLVYVATHLGDTLARGAQVSVLNPQINQGDPWGLLARQVVATLGMFNVRGDFIPRHNVPFRPVFDPILGIPFLVGLVLALRHWRIPQYGFILAWSAAMLLPTILAEDAPHFLRAVGILPVALLFPALGLDAVWRWLAERGQSRPAAVLLSSVLALGLAFTWRDYFAVHTQSDAAYYQFETGATELAADINRFLGAGWQGGWSEISLTPPRIGGPGGQIKTGHRVYVDPRLWDGWANLRYLASATGVSTLTPGQPIPEPSVLLALWPFEDHSATLAMLPRDGLIEGRSGANEQGDLEPAPRQLYYTVRVTPDIPPSNANADFGVARLLRAEWRMEGDQARVRLVWDASGPLPADVSAFIHVVGPSGLIDQADGAPGGFYPGRLWRSGDVVAEERTIPMPNGVTPTEMRVGLYDTRTLQRLEMVDGSDYIAIPGG